MSVVIPTRNRPVEVGRCLDSLAAPFLAVLACLPFLKSIPRVRVAWWHVVLKDAFLKGYHRELAGRSQASEVQ